MIVATDVFDKENKIVDATILAVYWRGEDEPQYLAVTEKQAAGIAQNWLCNGTAYRIEKVPENELTGKWIGIMGANVPGVCSAWGRARIAIVD
jgi:hypothetical protein